MVVIKQGYHASLDDDDMHDQRWVTIVGPDCQVLDLYATQSHTWWQAVQERYPELIETEK